MFPVQGTPDEAQPASPEDQGFFHHRTLWFVGTAVVLYLIFVGYLLWQEDEIKLQGLNSTVRLLHHVARTVGALALKLERQYNDYAELLH